MARQCRLAPSLAWDEPETEFVVSLVPALEDTDVPAYYVVVRAETERRERVHGRIRGGDLHPAPISGLPCVAFQVRAGGLSRTVHQARSHTFWIATRSGDVMGVESDGARVEFFPDDGDLVRTVLLVHRYFPDVSMLRNARRLPANVQDWLHEFGMQNTYGWVRIEELALRDGDGVLVEGVVDDEPPQGYRSSKRRVIRASDDEPIVIRARGAP